MDKLDILICLAAQECIEREADEFMSLEVAEDALTERKIRKIEKKCRQAEKGYTRFHALKVACVACLVVISLMFTACMSIKEVRTAIWNVIVDYYEDHIAVNFGTDDGKPDTDPSGSQNGPAGDTSDNNNGNQPVVDDGKDDEDNKPADEKPTDETPTVEIPETIEQKACLSFLPEGYSSEIKMETDTVRLIEVGNNSNTKFYFYQMTIISTDGLYVDYEENDIVTELTVNGYYALLVEYADEPGFFVIVWRDDKYEYSLQGNFDSEQQALQIAEAVRLE